MRSTSDGDSAWGAHAMEPAQAEHMQWKPRIRSTPLSTVELEYAVHVGNSACRAHAMETAHAEHLR